MDRSLPPRSPVSGFSRASSRSNHSRDAPPLHASRGRVPTLRKTYSLPSFSEFKELQSEWDKLPTPLCRHKDHCFQNAILKGFFRSFAVGYTFKATLSLGNLFFRGKVFKPGVASGVLLGTDAIRFGQFLGCMAGSYKAIVCFLRWYTRRRVEWHNAVAAFLSGWCLVIDDSSRRATMGLYVTVRAIDEIMRLLAKQGKIPTVAHMNFYVFLAAQLPIMLSFVHFPEALNKSYYRWILMMGNLTDSQVRGVYRGATTPFRLPGEPFVPCSPGFHADPSCLRHNTLDWFRGWLRAARIYLPVHFLPFLLFRPKSLLSKPVGTVTHIASAILWSSTFLTTYVFAMKQCMCTMRNLLQDDVAFTAVLGGFCTGLALLFENKRRHSELALYVVPRALEAVYNLFRLDKVFRRIVSPEKGSLFLFQIGLAMFLWCYNTDRPHMKGLNESVIRIIFGSPH